MGYQALYRAFRPQQFSELVGQEAVAQTLKNALLQDRLSHAYLFCGPRGTGKTSTAKILAKAVNCLHPKDGEPCNTCANCQSINEDSFLDVIEFDAASNRGIDEMREIKEQVYFAPAVGKKKVYIIDEVHMLTNEAFNALLKTLEEPPSHILFILATTDPQKIPLTVLSRTQRFDFQKISNEEIAKQLVKIAQAEEVTITPDAISLIARTARGGLRDAISLLDQGIAFSGKEIDKEAIQKIIGGTTDEELHDLVAAILAKDYAGTFQRLENLFNHGVDARGIIQGLTAYIRALMMLKIVGKDGNELFSGEDLKRAMVQAEAFDLAKVEVFLRLLGEGERDLRLSPDPTLVVEILLTNLLLELSVEGEKAVEKAPTIQFVPQAPAVPVPSQPSVAAAAPASEEPAAKGAEDSPSTTAGEDKRANWRELWPEVMKKVGNHSRRIEAFLKEAQVQGFEGEALLLAFDLKKAKFHFEQISKEENKKVIKDYANEVFGRPIRIKVIEDFKKNGTIEEETDEIVKSAKALFGEDKVVVTE